MIYPKIPGVFKRGADNKVRLWDWAEGEFDTLRDVPWMFTEKIDGMNMRVEWDGYAVQIAGRSDNASIPGDLMSLMRSTFTEELMEQVHGGTPVTYFGEGYGAGIQKGGDYGPDKKFILFDVFAGGSHWLEKENVQEIAKNFKDIPVPPDYHVSLTTAVNLVRGGLMSRAKDGFAEGLVGTPRGGLRNRHGGRIIVKVKHVDLYRGD